MVEKIRKDLTDTQAIKFKQGMVIVLIMALVCLGALWIGFKTLAIVSGGFGVIVLLAVLWQAVRHDHVSDE